MYVIVRDNFVDFGVFDGEMAALEKILVDNGYTMKEIPYMDDICELWAKW